MTGIREAEFQRALLEAINAPHRQTRVQRVNSGVFRRGGRVIRGALSGTGDLVGMVAPDGLYLEVEVKTQAGKLSRAQELHAAHVRTMGGLAVVARPIKGETLAEAVERSVAELDAAIADRRGVKRGAA